MKLGNLLARLSLLLLVIRLFSSFVFQSVTIDEFGHLPAGFNLLKTGDFRYCELNPPLANALSALPLVFLDVNRAETGSFDFWRNGYAFMAENAVRYHGWFLASRLISILAALFLGYFVFRWTNALYPTEGNLSGGLAMFLYSLCPNIAAHGTLATTDIIFCLFSLLALFCYSRHLRSMSPADMVLAGAILGLAQLTKFSALLLYPALAIVHLANFRDLLRRASPARSAFSLAAVFFISLITINAGYLFSEPYFLLPRQFLSALGQQIKDNAAGDFSYLLGETYIGTRPHYFLVALLVKTPVPVLAAFGLAFYLALSGKRRADWKVESLLLVPAALLFCYFSLLSRKQIGVRMILPLYPLLFIFCGSAAQWLSASRLRAAVAGFFGVCYIVSAAMIFPLHTAYFNAIAGGPERGLRWLADSNLDWGQELLSLRRYMEEGGIDEINLAYYGRVAPEIYGIKYRAALAEPQQGRVAVSAGLLVKPYLLWDHGRLVRVSPDSFAWAKSLKPVDSIGHSIYIYEPGSAK